MSSKYRCIACDKDFITSQLLKSHRQSMRKQNKTEGHELKVGESVAGSVEGSQIGTKDTKMNDVNDFDIPNMKKVKQEEAVTFGFFN